MGYDKAFALFAGRPLAGIARDALVVAGAEEVLSIGGDQVRLAGLGFAAFPDDNAGEGPLAGLLTALHLAKSDWVVVLACDLPRASVTTIQELLGHVDDSSDVVVPLLEGRIQPTHGVWRRSCRHKLELAFAGGERRLHAGMKDLRARLVAVSAPSTLRDVDRPEELHAMTGAES